MTRSDKSRYITRNTAFENCLLNALQLFNHTFVTITYQTKIALFNNYNVEE